MGWGIPSMNTKAYLKDRSYLLLTTLVVVFLLTTFLIALRIQVELIIIIDLCIVGLIGLDVVKEWSKRKKYYDELVDNVSALDKKYLVTEIIERGEFYDAQVLYDALYEINKATADTVSDLRKRQTDYKDYIELWIHEVKTPLAAIKLMASNGGEEMQGILEEVGHVENYLEQVLFYARSSSVEKDYLIQQLDIAVCVRNVIKEMSVIFIQKKIKLELEMDSIMVYSDPKWLEFMLKQILDNALKYTESETGIIKIEAKDYEQRVELVITDNGTGIAAADLPRLFERGFTGQTGRQHQQATGMGLFLVKELSDKLHLTIRIDSIKNEKTVVTIGFPKSNMMFKD